ncbi:MAG TPA: hypothetical protein VNZ06_00970 [Steroidobacteraceae bacterium]|jgi:hypothetical protein|nr:hypothetical protein [Steroidobacteraceae bacterium]
MRDLPASSATLVGATGALSLAMKPTVIDRSPTLAWVYGAWEPARGAGKTAANAGGKPTQATDLAGSGRYAERWVLLDSIYKESVPEPQAQYPALGWQVLLDDGAGSSGAA